MIAFLNSDTQARFHQLPIDRQRDWIALAEQHAREGNTLVVTYVEETPYGLEVSVRVEVKGHSNSV